MQLKFKFVLLKQDSVVDFFLAGSVKQSLLCLKNLPRQCFIIEPIAKNAVTHSLPDPNLNRSE